MVLLAAPPALGLAWVTTYSAHLALVCMFGLLTGVWIAATSPLLVRSGIMKIEFCFQKCVMISFDSLKYSRKDVLIF